ncbi:homoserine kinase [Aureitalea marina]|uniref:Homoserine kinase n=1 Tax=Aureitalea marina TaxID=930804 RepID=A0A2S7KM02_9FLAO|nr:homoserine kinase [Aureitalea marina]PQB03632.1 homoserine kinase [Aureitalea marina]
MDKVKVFSPATIANVSCGFDTLGVALDDLGDEMTLTKRTDNQLVITSIQGADLPTDPDRNVVSWVIGKILKDINTGTGVDIEIKKGFKPGSGLGSSAASGAGAAFAVNELLGRPLKTNQLIAYAREGERLVSGAPIADNVSAALLGGFILVRSYEPLEVISLPVPDNLAVAVIHPQIEIQTAAARDILPDQISMSSAITQWANLGGLVSALYEGDLPLFGRSLRDVVVEPHRKKLIPGFDQLKEVVMDHHALGFGISGSGPSLFAFCEGMSKARELTQLMQQEYVHTGIEAKVYASVISKLGCRLID